MAGRPLVLHSDNGSAMKGATMLATMQNLGVMPSFSRPRVSNDNAHAETVFRTAKYSPLWPEKPFDTLEEAQAWVQRFVDWYNNEHRHSGLNYVTPAQRHRGEAEGLLANRIEVYTAARERHPERWSGDIRDWSLESVVWLNPERGVCQANCVTPKNQSAARGTRSSPNITWKLCNAGFQWWMAFQFFDASRMARNSDFSAESSLGKMRRLRVNFRRLMFNDSMALVV